MNEDEEQIFFVVHTNSIKMMYIWLVSEFGSFVVYACDKQSTKNKFLPIVKKRYNA